MSMTNYKCILFDFDYTLFDSSSGIVKCFKYALKKLDKETVDDDIIKKTIGKSLYISFVEICGKSSTLEYQIFRKYFIEASRLYMVNNSVPYSFVFELLNWIKNNNIKTGIVTSKDRFTVEKILHKYKYDNLIDVIIGEEDVIFKKPSKIPLIKALKKLNINSDEALYIGDTIIDAQAAMNAKINFWAILSNNSQQNDFISFCSSKIYIFNSVKEVYDFLVLERGDNYGKDKICT